MQANEEKIRNRAYELWQQEGCPEGRDCEHWHQASREFETQGEDMQDVRSSADAVASPSGTADKVVAQIGEKARGGRPKNKKTVSA